ncbi:15838_t:CDS:2, partial [Rhizophagus irregularis]
QLRYIWKIGIKLMIEMDILVTKSFIDKVQEIEEMDVREKELKIKEWLEKETVICKRCGNRRFKMDKTDNECGEFSTSIDIKRDNNRQNMFAKPLNENYEDELVKAFEEKARISKLEGLVSNIERRLNNDNRN